MGAHENASELPMPTTYELIYLTPMLDAEADRTAIRGKAEQLIRDAGGTITVAREMGRQRLSYPIKGCDAAEYMLVEFSAPTTAPAAIDRELRMEERILRSLCVVKNAKARTVGATVDAMERMREQRDAAKVAVAAAGAAAAGGLNAGAADASGGAPEAIENLDEKLEEILGKEMV